MSSLLIFSVGRLQILIDHVHPQSDQGRDSKCFSHPESVHPKRIG
jgi:hypothetical protein